MGRSPLPTIAAVNGPAVGAGMNLALVCDVRLAGASARFDTRFLQLGHPPRRRATPGCCSGPSAPRRRPPWSCSARCSAAPRPSASVWCGAASTTSCCSTRPRELAARAAAAPRELLLRTKATLADVARLDDHDAAVDRELETQVWSMDQPDFAERLAALQRRITSS